MTLKIRIAHLHDLDDAFRLTQSLWPDASSGTLRSDLTMALSDSKQVVFLAIDKDTPIGFAWCSIRQDYVQGAETSPVGYLEGIFILEEHRLSGVAKQLIASGEAWAAEKGCREFGSDCEIDNTASIHFHHHIGFTETNRTVSFLKVLK